MDLFLPSVNMDLFLPSVNMDLFLPSVNMDLFLPSVNIDLFLPSVNMDLFLPSVNMDLFLPSEAQRQSGRLLLSNPLHEWAAPTPRAGPQDITVSHTPSCETSSQLQPLHEHHIMCVSAPTVQEGVQALCVESPRCSTGAPRLTTMTSSWRPHMSPPSHVSCIRSHSSSIKVRPYLQYMKRKIIAPPCPPYSHVCQVGDPVLRSHAAAVDPAAVPGAEVQQVIRTLVKVMRKLECVGLSAPQIGVPLRILALEYPEQMLKDSSPSSREARGLSVQPLRVFVNPTLRVLDGRTALFQEACLDERGGAVTWQASGWPARILQHEMDHLEGVLYIDRMDSKTFINIHWQEHNE
ncbi:hypothetical protein F7725_022380 [Dissostichus mawsoni]|uniref:Peptide deformylase n=1 Tax=Dissostichus mawsoni TaxID=36200 RepID=A0A7J5YXS9_DISMA|nr:hypothetical protein F7725_022380 [Dissostichus mawsoni]